MPTVEERVAYIEGQMSEQSHGLAEVRDAIRSLDQRMESRFDAVDRRFEAIDRRFEAIDRRFETMDDKMSRQFVWMVGIQVTTLIAIVGALLARA